MSSIDNIVSAYKASILSKITGAPTAIEAQALKSAASELAMDLTNGYLDAVRSGWGPSYSGSKMAQASGWSQSAITTSANGWMTLGLTYNGKLSRPSWYPKKYPDGISNIMSLLNTGYKASRHVYLGTEINGKTYFTQPSRLSRPATGFLDKAIGDFNKKHRGVMTAKFVNPSFKTIG